MFQQRIDAGRGGTTPLGEPSGGDRGGAALPLSRRCLLRWSGAGAAGLLAGRLGRGWAAHGAFAQERTGRERDVAIRRAGGAVVVEIDGIPVDVPAIVQTQRVMASREFPESGTPGDEPTGGGAPQATAAPELDPWAGPDVYLSHYLPFQPFPTPEALARALVDTEGRLWALDPGSGAPPVPAASHEHPPQLPGGAPALPGGAPADVPSATHGPAAAALGRFGWSAPAPAQRLPDVRRNVYELTRREWRRIVDALVRAKASGAYDRFVVDHLLAMGFAHRSPTFGPWHRWYLRRFELVLQSFVPGVTIPYWDWAQDALRPDPAAAPLWTRQYLGGDGDPGNGDRVQDGPFAGWSSLIQTATGASPTAERPGIIRALGRSGATTWTLPGPADVDAAMGWDVYDVAPFDTTSPSGFRNALEGWAPVMLGGAPGLHNQVHLWVGGDMVAATSPNDPAFWLHHANVDRLWVRWQRRFPAAGYEPRSGGPTGLNLDDPIAWMDEPGGPTISPAGTLDPLALGYAYEE